MRRSLAVLGILAGLALLILFGGARFLVERLNGSTPWTGAAFVALALVVAGLALSVGGGVALARRRT